MCERAHAVIPVKRFVSAISWFVKVTTAVYRFCSSPAPCRRRSDESLFVCNKHVGTDELPMSCSHNLRNGLSFSYLMPLERNLFGWLGDECQIEFLLWQEEAVRKTPNCVSQWKPVVTKWRVALFPLW